MNYLLDSEGYYLAIVDSPTEGVEIGKPLPECPNTQKRKWDGSDWIVEDDQSEIDKKALWEANTWLRNRKAEYPDMGSQLNKIYDDGVTKWKSEMVDPIKAKWPKDNSGPK
tara:strand:- start:476 stop:808 length:333 start_codon:yes stop_codon:yes gene_type:complete